MTGWITGPESLHAHYGTPGAPALRKVAQRLTPAYAALVARSRFCVLFTVGPEGTDGSPRGDRDPVAMGADADNPAVARLPRQRPHRHPAHYRARRAHSNAKAGTRAP